jgi:hypothetical protein
MRLRNKPKTESEAEEDCRIALKEVDLCVSELYYSFLDATEAGAGTSAKQMIVDRLKSCGIL